MEYVVYDLATPDKAAVEVKSPTVTDLDYRTGSKVLFVRDGAIEEPVYISVYEVTQAQAAALKWIDSPATGTAGIAYGFSGNDFAGNHSLADFPWLTFPTGALWEAYAGDPKRPCNVFDGIADDPYGPISLSDWFTYAQSHTLPAPHGALDMYGNVAEFVSEGNFRGGYASYSCSFSTSLKSKTWSETAISAVDGFGRKGARLVYTPPKAITYTAIVKLDGKPVGEPISATPGTEVALTPPTPTEGNRLQGPIVTPEDLTYTGTTFEMPEEDVTFAYTSQPYATLQVIGGTASASEVVAGETVTLTATPGAYQVFTQWTLPDGSTATESPLSYTVPTVTPGKTLAFTASFQTYPRVLVYGGTATLATGKAYGEGFYSPKARLTLSAPAPTGYTFTGWTVSAGSGPSGNAYTVGSYDSTVTLTANFTPTTVYNDTDTYIGEADHTASTKTMRAALGYEIVGYTTKELGSSANRFGVFPYNKPSGDYAKLDLENKRIEYGSSVRNSDTNKSTILPLKRVTAGGSTYYLGIYETTAAHVEYIKRLADASYTVNEAKTTSYIPHEVTSLDEAKSYLATLNAAFPMSATLPSREQIVNITATYYTGEANYPGGAGSLNATGTYGDPTITEKMMWFNHSKDGPTVVGSMDVDPYGFYDLWGNANELWSDGKLWGGSFNQPYAHYCNAEATDGSFANYNWASFRPLSVVPETTAVKVVVDGGSFETSVLANQTIYLAPQVKTGCDFTGWTATTASGTKTVTKSGSYYPYTVTEAVTLTASFKAKPVVSVAYTNCSGPTTVLPGATVTLYAATPTGEAPTEVTISPARAATWNAEAGTLTFSETASGSVTVTATYPDPTPPKPGYKVYLQ